VILRPRQTYNQFPGKLPTRRTRGRINSKPDHRLLLNYSLNHRLAIEFMCMRGHNLLSDMMIDCEEKYALDLIFELSVSLGASNDIYGRSCLQLVCHIILWFVWSLNWKTTSRLHYLNGLYLTITRWTETK
jgi:hypothetical protein